MNNYSEMFGPNYGAALLARKNPNSRCPKHDTVFLRETDDRLPGAEGMPVNGHPDCPLCKRDIAAKWGTRNT
jgi:hypothetical protein